MIDRTSAQLLCNGLAIIRRKNSRSRGFVPEVGIEPTLLAEHEFESCASTNSAIRANGGRKSTLWIAILPRRSFGSCAKFGGGLSGDGDGAALEP